MTSRLGRCSVFAMVVVLSRPAAAQVTASYERVLIPIAACANPIAGAFGTMWQTELSFVTTASQPVWIEGYDQYPHGCGLALCIGSPTPPQVTINAHVCRPSGPAAILLVIQQFADAVAFHLQTRDTTGNAPATELPVVRASRVHSARVDLTNVTLQPGSRTRLRIYDLSPQPGSQARIRFFRVDPNVHTTFNPVTVVPADPLLGERTLPLELVHTYADTGYDYAYAELPYLETIGELAGATNIRIAIESTSADSRVWAFVTATDNASQQIVTFTPQ